MVLKRFWPYNSIKIISDIADCSDKEPKYFMLNFPFYQTKTESIIKRKEKKSSLSERFYQSLMLRNICTLESFHLTV